MLSHYMWKSWKNQTNDRNENIDLDYFRQNNDNAIAIIVINHRCKIKIHGK